MQGCKITSNPFARIKHKHPLKQIHGTTRHSGEPRTEVLLGVLRKGPHVSAGVIASEEPKACVIRWPYQLLDQEWTRVTKTLSRTILRHYHSSVTRPIFICIMPPILHWNWKTVILDPLAKLYRRLHKRGRKKTTSGEMKTIPRLLASADEHNPFQETEALVWLFHRGCSLLTTYQ